MVVSQRDLHAVLAFVGEVNDADDLAEFRQVVVPGLRRLVRSDLAAYNEIVAGGVPVATITDPVATPEAYAAWARYAGQNPLYQRLLRTRDGRAYRLSDVIERREFEALELYREVFSPLGVDHQVAFALPAPRHLVVGLALSRGGPDYSQRDRDVLDLLRPHLVQAYRNAELRERSRSVVDALRHGLDDTAEAIVVLNAAGEVAFATNAGRALLERAADDQTIAARLAAWQAGPLGGAPLTLAPGLVARVVQSGPGTGTVLFFDDLRRSLSRQRLLEIGLTEREAEVLQQFAAGSSSTVTAAALAIRPRTVDKHSQNIARKLGARSRAQAVATAVAATTVAEQHRAISPPSPESRS
ncbi:helix-turn-helix transcriptional regulator [Conexibacter sp. CPCC 206217]|uniref:helix-turn-helix transcriptional regulator n=1 Tax=Conexibacter sp. CPCC 206217 TaxID=3064574 RepID=UPI0027214199|nr:helix-turn-helix transcriptional regulator [Conexibacter sp. CPCC 206217]MDO8210280.1 helix-turn-helix transcriptional regulator [Conexibacter sp. CPCC 206217]